MTTSAPRDVHEILEHEFLTIRCKILEVAAALDRLDRAPERPGHHLDPRLDQIRRALETLLHPDSGRAETVQRLFSREYKPSWRQEFGMDRSGD